jgi:hypothetical protein
MKKHRIILVALLALLILWGHQFERIPSNNQSGWDGKHYADLVVEMNVKWQQQEIDAYLFQRILPSAIGYTLFHHIIKKPNVSRSDAVTYFLWLNTVLIALSVLAFFLISKYLQWSTLTEIILFTAMFFNFAILKQTWYYPVLTDVFAFALGIWLIYCYLKQWHATVYIIACAGAMVYPLFLPSVLLLYSYKPWVLMQNGKLSNVLRMLVLGGVVTFIFLYLTIPDKLLHPRYVMNVNKAMIPLSIVALFAYLWHVIRPINSQKIQTYFHTSYANFIGIMMLLSYVLYHLLVLQKLPQEENFTSRVFLLNIMQQSISNPLAFIVYHTIYLGPMILVMLVTRWHKTQHVHVVFFALAYVMLGIGTETRQFINAWPVLLVAFAPALNNINTNRAFVYIFVALSLIQSHFYLPINREGIYESYQYGKFPEQFYFMHHGPFATHTSYAINAACCVLMGLILYLAYRYKNKNRISI